MNPCSQYEFRHSAEGEHACTREQIIETLKKIAKKWIFQLERSHEGYVHWQGSFSLIKKSRKNTLLELLRTNSLVQFMHMAPICHAGTAFAYVTKLDTRVEGPWKDTDFQDQYIPRQYRNLTLRPWQQMILEMNTDFDTRKINYVWDQTGNHGKSTIASIMELMHGCVDLPPVNDAKQLMESLCDILMARETRNPGTIFMDLPRCMGKERLNGVLTAVEEIKKGKAYDMRNHYRQWWFDSPNIWVFSNTKVPRSDLSSDRWVVWKFEGDNLVQTE